MERICKNCGMEISEEDVYCKYCGFKNVENDFRKENDLFILKLVLFFAFITGVIFLLYFVYCGISMPF